MGNFSNSCFSNKEAVVGIIWLQFSPTLQSLSDKTFFLLFPIKPNCDIEILEVQATNQWIRTTFFPFVFENSFPNQSPFFYIFVFYLYIHISVSVYILYIVLVFSLLSDRNNWFQFFARPMISWSPHWWERKGSIVSEQSLHHRTKLLQNMDLYQLKEHQTTMVYKLKFFSFVLNFLSTLGNYIFPNQFDSSTLSLTKKRIVKDRLKVKD